jgi:hypothetical protein
MIEIKIIKIITYIRKTINVIRTIKHIESFLDELTNEAIYRTCILIWKMKATKF